MFTSRYIFILRLLLVATDLMLINVCFLAVHYIEFGLEANIPNTHYNNYLFISNLLWMTAATFVGLYRNTTVSNVVMLYRMSFRAFIIHFALFMVFLFFSGNADIISRLFVGYYYVAVAFGVIVTRFAGTYIEQKLIKMIKQDRPIAVIGKNSTGLRLATYLQNQGGYHFEGFLDDKDGFVVNQLGQLETSEKRQLAYAAQLGINDVLVSLTPERMVEAPMLLKEAERLCVRVRFVPDLTGTLNNPFTVSYMDEFPVISLRDEPLQDIDSGFKKRVFDILFSVFVLVFIMSWLTPILALLIKLESRGPVFFKQQRSGKDNKPFWCYKFRSMRVNNDSDSLQATKNDSRLTHMGAFMRKTNIDELPQFFNVLIGNMSVIGPRPHMLKHTEEYRKLIDQYMVRQFLKPGLSGWAQINGLRGETKDTHAMKSRVEHDIYYMENWSLMFDVKIVALTLINMLRGEEKAY